MLRKVLFSNGHVESGKVLVVFSPVVFCWVKYCIGTVKYCGVKVLSGAVLCCRGNV